MRRRFRRVRGAGRRRHLEPQGRERARRGAAAGGALGQGPQGPRVRVRPRRRLAGAVVRAAGGRRRGGAGAGQGAGVHPVEDREAQCGQGVRRDPRGIGRHHGGARRPRRRTAGAERAADPEAAGAQVSRGRQAGDRGDPDAREHDRKPDADPRRGVGCGDGDLRGGRCDHAVGGIGRRIVPDRGGDDDEQRGDGGRGGPHLYPDHRGLALCAAAIGGRRHRRRRPRDRRDHGNRRHLLFLAARHDSASGEPRAAPGADHRAHLRGTDGAAAVPVVGLQLCGDGRRRSLQARGPCRRARRGERGDRHQGRSDRRDRRRAVQHAGVHQHPARRPLR